jgi:hypothetical protein
LVQEETPITSLSSEEWYIWDNAVRRGAFVDSPGGQSGKQFCDECAKHGRLRVAYYPTAQGWACWEHFAPNAESERDRISRSTDDRHSHREIARRLGSRRPRPGGRD